MILIGNCIEMLGLLDAESIQTCVTSPPYFGLRDYGVAGQLGLEHTVDHYVAHMVEVFRQVKRVLRDDGTLWLNLGDSYAASGRGGGGGSFQSKDLERKITKANQRRAPVPGYKQKDLLGIPWHVAFALQADGWYLRSDIVWNKPNCMPESVSDRPTRSHEYIFLLSKSKDYYYNADAIREPVQESTVARAKRSRGPDHKWQNVPGQTTQGIAKSMSKCFNPAGRNRRTVWTVSTRPFKGAHFATFPTTLIEPCILAGSKEGDTVLDPFFGAGTTGLVAQNHGRKWVGCELNPEYAHIAMTRLAFFPEK